MDALYQHRFAGWALSLALTAALGYSAASLAIADCNYGWALFVAAEREASAGSVEGT